MDVELTSPRLPGKDLISATLDRRVMGLADRGGASGMVGQRWADLCADQTSAWPGRSQPIIGSDEQFQIARVARLDDVPAIAATAARRKLQNPDIVLVGEGSDGFILQALDAKFSVETARAKQVSSEMLTALLDLRSLLEPLTGPLPDHLTTIDGLFLCPDFPLTHLMFRRRQGIVRPSVRPDQVMLLPAPPDLFFDGVDGADLIPVLETVDRLPVRSDESLLAGLYYFRLSRAAMGIWSDAHSPLLLNGDRAIADQAAVQADLQRMAPMAASAWGLIQDWNVHVDIIRNQRAAVDQVAGLPLGGRELRDRVDRRALQAGFTAPSANKVRRRIGAWYREQLREKVGPILPPVADMDATLRDVAHAGTSLQGSLRTYTDAVIDEMVADMGDVPDENVTRLQVVDSR